MKPANLHIVIDQKALCAKLDNPHDEKNVREKRHWDDESIILAYADWFMENRRIPSHKEIIENGLSPESVIRSYFGVPPINFYQDYFSELYCSEEVLDALEYFYI